MLLNNTQLSPPKKPNLKTSTDFSVSLKTQVKNSKQRAIPSGITVTQRQNPQVQGSNVPSSPISQYTSAPNINHAITSIINDERQTPTPPKLVQGSSLAAQITRKRKTPTPPQAMSRMTSKSFANNMSITNIMSPAAAATTMAPLPPIMPMIAGVHSAAGATTLPHNLGAFTGLNDQMIMNPIFHPSLPPNTTITAHSNLNHNNLNNNFKIHLPPKPVTTPSPAASPSAPKTPSPSQIVGPSTQRRADKLSKRAKLTTVLKSTDEAWQQQRNKIQLSTDKHNDDVVELTMLSPTSLSRQQTSPKSYKSPTSSTTTTSNDVLDLTDSPDRNSASTVINLTDTMPSTNSSDKKQLNGEDGTISKEHKNKGMDAKPPSRAPLEPEYAELIKACREADRSDDMEKLIKTKLIKYYYEVHEDFVKSKSFRKNIRKVVETIRAEPDLVYYNLKTIVEELKARRKAKIVESPAHEKTEEKPPAAEDTTSSPLPSTSSASNTQVATPSNVSTGNKKLDEQIKKLNKALYVLTKRIEVLEETAVDWDDDDSSFLQVERFKKRACQIYEKICDLTGESKNARRLVKKPIKFNETRIPQFNKTLQAFINRTKEFPDYFDVLRMLEHCNKTYNLGLVNFEMKNIAEDAFIKVGKLLQSRRKAELYETVTHYGGNSKDPALVDPALAAKLSENQKNHKKISEILEKYARKQDMPDEDEEENKADNKEKSGEREESLTNDSNEQDSEDVSQTTGKDALNDPKPKIDEIREEGDGCKTEETTVVESEYDDEDEDEDDEEEVNLEDQVETLANGEISENESDNENNDSIINKDSPVVRSILNEKNDSVKSSEGPADKDSLTFQQDITISVNTNLFQSVKVNNNNLENTELKTATNSNAITCVTPPNGKLKELDKHVICASTSPSTTTATADFKIVSVSSLDEEILSFKNSECTSKVSTDGAAPKALDEIVISDEES
ncbi:daxx-like protein isoform X2 [Musca domestica]|uniref:Death domain-associated protein 6 isoform X2 n=1 Tax=Musca domestica TaxID=7370 RepID=A0A1I8M3D4_MUSDO|nr:daxx-like protein isoform X2 [Musca domestica]